MPEKHTASRQVALKMLFLLLYAYLLREDDDAEYHTTFLANYNCPGLSIYALMRTPARRDCLTIHLPLSSFRYVLPLKIISKNDTWCDVMYKEASNSSIERNYRKC